MLCLTNIATLHALALLTSQLELVSFLEVDHFRNFRDGSPLEEPLHSPLKRPQFVRLFSFVFTLSLHY